MLRIDEARVTDTTLTRFPATKTLGIVVPTVGERHAIEALKAFKEHTTVKHDLIVWYNAIGHFDWRFFDKDLRQYTDDIVLCTKNKGVIEALGFSMLYLDYDYLVWASCDVAVTSDYLDKLYSGLLAYPHTLCAGQSSYKEPFLQHALWSPTRFCPDKVVLYDRKALNDVGAISPSFKIFGDGHTEHFYRAHDKQWGVVEVQGVVQEITNIHSGSSLLANKEELVNMNINTLLRMKDSGFGSYDWWRNDI